MCNLLFFPLPLESFQNIYKFSREQRKKENKVALCLFGCCSPCSFSSAGTVIHPIVWAAGNPRTRETQSHDKGDIPPNTSAPSPHHPNTPGRSGRFLLPDTGMGILFSGNNPESCRSYRSAQKASLSRPWWVLLQPHSTVCAQQRMLWARHLAGCCTWSQKGMNFPMSAVQKVNGIAKTADNGHQTRCHER